MKNKVKEEDKMNEEIMREKYLPVGTVVLLKNGSKRIMINGFCTMDAKQPERIYDYSGVLFPEGSLSSDQTLLFDHDQIVRIDHIGLEDEEEKAFKLKLVELLKQQSNPLKEQGVTDEQFAKMQELLIGSTSPVVQVPKKEQVYETQVDPIIPVQTMTPLQENVSMTSMPSPTIEQQMPTPMSTPVAPIEPVAPVAPVQPVIPVVPIEPVTPVAPVQPVTPVAPIEPVAPVAPVQPVAPVDPTNPTTF